MCAIVVNIGKINSSEKYSELTPRNKTKATGHLCAKVKEHEILDGIDARPPICTSLGCQKLLRCQKEISEPTWSSISLQVSPIDWWMEVICKGNQHK
jgi:hypothetical protein